MTTTERIEPFTYYENEQGDFTVTYKVNTESEQPVAVLKSKIQAKLSCLNLNSILQREIASVIGKERPKIDEMAEAMREFCERVEKGEVRSVRTYNKFKAILSDLTPKTDTTDGEEGN